MSEVTSPIILNSTGQDIALALAGLATAIANKPDPELVEETENDWRMASVLACAAVRQLWGADYCNLCRRKG